MLHSAVRVIEGAISWPLKVATREWLMKPEVLGPSVVHAYPAKPKCLPGELVGLWPDDKSGRCSLLLPDFTQENPQAPGLPRVVTMWSPTEIVEVRLVPPPSPAVLTDWPPRGHKLIRLFPHPWRPETVEVCEQWIHAVYFRASSRKLPPGKRNGLIVAGKAAQNGSGRSSKTATPSSELVSA